MALPSQDTEIYLNCPHCGNMFMTTEQSIACAIYRHAVLKSNMEQINPHASEVECQTFVNNDLIYGCGGPFRITKTNGAYSAVVCGYE